MMTSFDFLCLGYSTGCKLYGLGEVKEIPSQIDVRLQSLGYVNLGDLKYALSARFIFLLVYAF
jgi:hypothetical protein